MKITDTSYRRWKAASAVFIAVIASQLLLFLPNASAGSLTSTYLRASRLSTGATGSLRLVFTTAAAGATALTIDMNGADGTTWSGQSGSVHAGSMTTDVSTCHTDTGATSLPGSLSVTGASGHTISVTGITALAATTSYCVDFTNSDAVTNPSAGTYHPTITESAGATDSSTVAIDIVGSNADQITVSASVSPSFTFSLSSNSAALGALSASSPTKLASPINATVSTNAAGGWQMWAADPAGTPGLHSTAAGKTITYSPAAGAAASALSTNVEGYNLGTGTLSGTTCGTPTYGNFASGGVNYKGSGLDNSLRSLVSTTGAADTCALPLTVNASISNTTPAATDYAGTMTVVAAGLF